MRIVYKGNYIRMTCGEIGLVDDNFTGWVQMGLDARKPVFGGLRTTQAQTSLRIRAV